MSPSVLSSKQIRLNIFGYKAFLKNHFLVNFIVRSIKEIVGLNLDATNLSQSSFEPLYSED